MMKHYNPLVTAVRASRVPARAELSASFISDVFSAGAIAASVATEGIRVKFEGSRAGVYPWGTWLVLLPSGAVSLSDEDFRASYEVRDEAAIEANGTPAKVKANA